MTAGGTFSTSITSGSSGSPVTPSRASMTPIAPNSFTMRICACATSFLLLVVHIQLPRVLLAAVRRDDDAESRRAASLLRYAGRPEGRQVRIVLRFVARPAGRGIALPWQGHPPRQPARRLRMKRPGQPESLFLGERISQIGFGVLFGSAPNPERRTVKAEVAHRPCQFASRGKRVRETVGQRRADKNV